MLSALRKLRKMFIITGKVVECPLISDKDSHSENIKIKSSGKTYTLKYEKRYNLYYGDAVTIKCRVSGEKIFSAEIILGKIGQDILTAARIFSDIYGKNGKSKLVAVKKALGDEILKELDTIVDNSLVYYQGVPGLYSDDARILKSWFTKHRHIRQLSLIGIDKEEYESLIMTPLALYTKCSDNPFKLHTLTTERKNELCEKLLNLPNEETFAFGAMLSELSLQLEKSAESYCDANEFITKMFEELDGESVDALFELLGESDPVEIFNLAKTKGFMYVLEDGKLYTTKTYYVESGTAEFLHKAKQQKKRELKISFKNSNLSEIQKASVRMALDGGVSIITGAAGTGKTTVIKTIVENLEKNDENFIITSFTGKAVCRLREVVGDYDIQTMHMFLNKGGLSKFSWMIVDETSMVSTELFYRLTRRFRWNYNIIFVGDKCQLEPIGTGSLFKACINSKIFPVTNLEEIFRTDDDQLLENVSRMEKFITGKSDSLEFSLGSSFVQYNDDLVGAIEMVKETGMEISDFKIIAPYNKTNAWINKLSNKIWNSGKVVGSLRMMKKNDYENNIMNGTEGVVKKWDSVNKTMTIDFNGTEVTYGKHQKIVKGRRNITTDNIIPSYSITIDSSQGSEWEIVIMYLPSGCKAPFLNRNRLYTALTRAKSLLIFVGSIKELVELFESETKPRNDTLMEMLVDWKA